jgi:hypothetical protein
MLKWLATIPAKWIKYPGLRYGAPKIPYTPEDQAHKPVVLLFGWLGASERHLGKYTQLYQDKGYETIHYIPPMSLILYPSRIDSLNAEIQADMMRIMKEKGLLRRPFMIHLFSNSGYINWCYYQRHLQKHVPNTAFNIYYKIQGTIVDSAPCNLNPEVLARGFLGALIPKIQNHRHWLWTPLMETFWKVYLRIPGNTEEFNTLNRIMNHTNLPYPQWYMYSSGDTMLYASEVRKHIKRVEKRTHLPTQSIDFVTSNHVSHLREHPVEYSKRIDAVLDRVETNWTALLEALEAHSANKLYLPPKSVRKILAKKTKRVKKLL